MSLYPRDSGILLSPPPSPVLTLRAGSSEGLDSFSAERYQPRVAGIRPGLLRTSFVKATGPFGDGFFVWLSRRSSLQAVVCCLPFIMHLAVENCRALG